MTRTTPSPTSLATSAISGRLVGSLVPRAELAPVERYAMWRLFRRYYTEVERSTFERDLDDKDVVIVLRDSGDGTIQGFSTLKVYEREILGRRITAIFSGDTVVDTAYWGQSALHWTFLRFLVQVKLRRPLTPVYWFLISKGYKTYLLMSNNFAEHYPRHEQPTPPAEQEVLDAFATALFPADYDPARGLIAFQDSLGHLKGGVAGITTEMLENPRIRYFQQRNPTWRAGTELACIARMTWSMPIYYTLKAVLKRLPGARRAQAALAAAPRD